jgi:hypothetical protein
MSGARRADDFQLPADVMVAATHMGVDIQHHLIRLGDPDPAKRPTTAQALDEAQRLRERIIAAGVG